MVNPPVKDDLTLPLGLESLFMFYKVGACDSWCPGFKILFFKEIQVFVPRT